MKKIIGIYKITSPSGKVYIGQSIDVFKRLKKHISDCHVNNIKLYNSLKKYGVKKHLYDIIEECSIDMLNERERYWQEYYNCVNNGLNCILTSTKEKKKVFSEETKNKISKSRLGVKPWNKGLKLDERTKSKIRKTNTGKKASKITIEKHKINNSRGGNPMAKKVINTKTKEVFSCIKDAADTIGMNGLYLAQMLRGKRTNKTDFIYLE